MRIREEHKRSGYFWLSSNEERKIPGTLTIADGGVIELEVLGSFSPGLEAFHEPNDFQRIMGHVEKEGSVTLVNCFYRKKSIPLGGITKSVLHVHAVFAGNAFRQDEQFLFNSFKFSVEGLDEWLGMTGLRSSLQLEEPRLTIDYSPPEEISIGLNNGMKLVVTFSWTISGPARLTESRVTQKAYLKLVSDEKRDFEEFSSVAHKITTLLCFAIDKTVSLDEVTATSDDLQRDIGNGRKECLPIRIYYPSLPFSEVKPNINSHGILFGFERIRGNFKRLINTWLDGYEIFEPALDLYFASISGAHRYVDHKFLSLAQGLETYHRRTSDAKCMDEADFRDLVDHLIGQCPEDWKEWLESRLAYSNELSLAQRLKEVIRPFKKHLGNSRERERFIRNVVDTRNYLTHYDESSKPQVCSGTELFTLYQKLEACFQLLLLQVLGFCNDDIEHVLEEHLAWKLHARQGVD